MSLQITIREILVYPIGRLTTSEVYKPIIIYIARPGTIVLTSHRYIYLRVSDRPVAYVRSKRLP